MAEWFKALVLKTDMSKDIASSNLALPFFFLIDLKSILILKVYICKLRYCLRETKFFDYF